MRISHHFPFGGGVSARIRACIAVSPEWTLLSTISPDFSWNPNPYVDINPPFGHIKIGIAEYAEPKLKAKLPEVSAKIEQIISKADIRSAVEKAWLAAGKPLPLSNNPAASLEIEPEAIGVGAPVSAGPTLVIRPALVAKLRAHLGAPDTPLIAKPLPNNSGDVTAPDGFWIAVRADVPYAELNRELEARFVGKLIDLEKGRSLSVTGAKVTGYGERLAVRVDFSAKLPGNEHSNIQGWVYLVGKPVYDDATNTLSVSDLDFNEDSNRALIDAAATILHPILVKKLEAGLKFDLTKYVEPIRAKVAAGVQGKEVAPGVFVNATANSFSISTIYVAADSVAVLSSAKGAATVEVEQIPGK